MTLDQAIDRYTNNAEYERIHGSLQGCLDFRQLAEWLKDYKRLLEQQPCEDVISREAVIEWLKAKDIIKLSSQEETARKELKALPPVTPQQKYGKWIVVSDGYGDRAYICECSECKDTVWVYKDANRKWNFCPSCGAKMQERSDEE